MLGPLSATPIVCPPTVTALISRQITLKLKRCCCFYYYARPDFCKGHSPDQSVSWLVVTAAGMVVAAAV